jgi:hypothetical protein
MSALRLAVRLGTVAVTCGALIVPSAAIAKVASASKASVVPAHKGIVPPKNPSKSLRPSPFFLGSNDCRRVKDGAGCNTGALKAIARARKVLEKMAGMGFSLKAYEKLTAVEQLFVTANLERVSRGLTPAVVLTKSLDKVAQEGANTDLDPPLNKVPDPLPGGGRFVGLGGNWAGGWDNALGSDYAWMYDDGLGSGNLDCKKGHTQGCWGHRDNILGRFNSKARCGGQRNELAMGAGHVTKGKEFGDSETELFAGVCGRTPTDVVMTWARAKKLLHIK